MHFLVFSLVVLLPVLDDFGAKLLARATMDGIHGDTALQLLELLVNLRTLCLLFVELVLEFTGHLVVSLLGLAQVVADLMDVG
jgi:hypothetical protein